MKSNSVTTIILIIALWLAIFRIESLKKEVKDSYNKGYKTCSDKYIPWTLEK